MRRPRIRAQVVSGAVLALLTAAGAAAPAADAATGPTFTQVYCGDTSYVASCEFVWSGGTSPYTFSWTAVRGLSGTGGSDTTAGNSAHVASNCIPQNFFEVKATVTDAAGLSATTYAGGTCD